MASHRWMFAQGWEEHEPYEALDLDTIQDLFPDETDQDLFQDEIDQDEYLEIEELRIRLNTES